MYISGQINFAMQSKTKTCKFDQKLIAIIFIWKIKIKKFQKSPLPNPTHVASTL